MLLRRISDFILQGRLQAIGAAFVCAFIPWVSSVSVIIAGLVTLRKGAFEGSLVLIAASLPIVVNYVVYPDSASSYPISLLAITLIMLVSNFLTWAFAVLLRQYSSWSMLMEFTALVSLIAVGVVHFVYPGVTDWWGSQIAGYFANVAKTIPLGPGDLAQQKAVMAQMVDAIKIYATGIVVAFIAFNALLQLLLARWWQDSVFNPGGLRKELINIRMSYAAGIIFLLALVVAYTGNAVVVDMIPILYLTFALAGLSLVHCLVTESKQSWLWLSLVYLLVIIVFVFALTVLAMTALLDTWLDIRKRLKKV